MVPSGYVLHETSEVCLFSAGLRDNGRYLCHSERLKCFHAALPIHEVIEFFADRLSPSRNAYRLLQPHRADIRDDAREDTFISAAWVEDIDCAYRDPLNFAHAASDSLLRRT